MSGTIHSQHRDRVKRRFRKEGLDSFDQIHVLELLLFFGIPQGDVNPLAHQLIDRFGSLRQVLEAPAEELEKVKGVGPHVSTLLKLTSQIARYYYTSAGGPELRIFPTIKDCGEHLKRYVLGRREETVYLMCLDAKCMMLACQEIGRGSVNTAGVSVRRVVETALSHNATSVILAHNHPSGIAVPSTEDVVTTRRVATALDAVGITLADHIVVADDDYVSLVESGYYSPEECGLLV